MEIAKATQGLTTAADMRETTKMLMQPNANWEEYLTPAPLSIAIMGELVFISSCGDFSINKNPPEKGYKYIQYPDSFRACLMQICNSGWHAFNEAHKNMDQIRLHTATVPDYMKAAVKLLFNAPDEVIEKLLPNQLENIRTIADECVTLSGSVEKKYTDVINLIQELLAACVNAEHFHGEELEKVKMKIKENEIREKTASELKERSKKAIEAMEKEMNEAQDSYKKAMDSLPSEWKMIGMDVVEGLSMAVTGIVNGVTNLVSFPGKVISGVAEVVSHTIHQSKTLTQYLKEVKIAWRDLYDQKAQSTKTNWSQAQFKRISEALKQMKGSKLQEDALKLCELGIKICEELATYKPGENWSDKKEAELIEKLKKLDGQSRIFDTKSKKVLGSPALSPTSPMMSKAQSSTGDQSASQRAADNARFKIEQSREQLNETWEAYEKSVERMEQNEKFHQSKSQNENVDVLSVCCKSAEILSIVGTLTQYLKEGKIAWQDLHDQKAQSTKTNWSQAQFKRISEALKQMKGSKLQEDALKLCELGIKICEELATYKPGENWSDKKEAELIEKLKKLDEESRIFDTKSKKVLGSPALSPTPPMMSKAQSSTGGQSASQRAADNARFKIEQSREQLKVTREAYEKSVERMEQNEKELTEILVEMQNCKLNKIDFETTIEMLVKGLDAMGRVKEQWEKMVRFFQMISNIIKCSLSKTLKDFVSTADDTKKLSYNSKLFVKDMLYNQAFQASNIASLVHMISGTYTEVSNKYLMDRVSSLGKLMAMDKEKPEFLRERLELQQYCKDAQDGILKLVLKNKKEFQRKTDDRMAKIENGLKAILPAAPPQETERIKEIVQAGFGGGEEDYY